MIIKNFDINENLIQKINYYLFYGPNEGLISETISKKIKPFFTKNIYHYDEKDILENIINFKESVLHKSLFDEDKFIIVHRATDKILTIIEEIIQKKIDGIKIIFKSDILEKKSKLRKFFEKSDEAIISPFYNDTEKTLSLIAFEFFKKKNIKISNEIVNLIVQKVNYNRTALNLELEKISNYRTKNQNINFDSVQKLVNLFKDYDVSEIVNQSLAKNKKNIVKMLNENSLMNEKSIIFLRTFLSSLKRLKNLKISLEKNKNIDKILNVHKPPIFWRDKEIIKKQLSAWNLKEIKSLLKKINDLELKIKKNSQITNHMINNFILEIRDS